MTQPAKTQAEEIIARFGGIRPMARKLSAALGRRVPVTTIQGWAMRGVIPPARRADVLAAAEAEGIGLGAFDFEDTGRPAEAAAAPGAEAAGPELLTVAEMGTADRMTIEGGVAGHSLMEAAGRGAADAIRARFRPCPVLVLCGPGNNGGDGFVIARHLAAAGWPVRLALLGDVARLAGDAGSNARRWLEVAGADAILAADPVLLDGAGLVVDALFGAGLARPLEGTARALVEGINQRALPCVAIDMPSGVDGDSGAIRGAAARATLTITFFLKKPGHLLMPGREFCGEVTVVDIGIGRDVLAEIAPKTFENGPALWAGAFPWPRAGDHKYSRGHLVISGGTEMTGAARLAARAGLRAGAGLVTIACEPPAVPVYASYMPAVLTHGLRRARDFADYLDDPRRRAVLLGPGNGVNAATHARVLTALALGKRVCLDADALTVFEGRAGELFAALAANADAGGAAVLTPHEGEFARLFKGVVEAGGGNKLARAREAAARAGAVVLLKGPDTVIAAPDGRALINANAPPTLATGGTGDVLAGLIAGFLVQGAAPLDAAGMAAWIHGAAAESFGPGLVAEDLPDLVPGVLRALRAA